MTLGISLAQKCQILFGAAVLLIMTAAVSVPWIKAGALVDQSQLEASRRIADIWPDLANLYVPVDRFLDPLVEAGPNDQAPERTENVPRVLVSYVTPADFDDLDERDGFAARALAALRNDAEREEYVDVLRASSGRAYRYARADRAPAGDLVGFVLVEHRSSRVASQLFIGRLYLLVTALIVGALAIGLFYLITMRIILGPVRKLRDTAERIREGGGVGVRADIQTGDEFEELGEAFNSMLVSLEETQDRLRGINASLDLKVAELSEANRSLHEAAQLKGDFLATVSHELRTPLNSIIGFAELLIGIARTETPDDGGQVRVDPAQFAKRTRYLEHILSAGRTLLEMINELLEMARIEAGKVDLHVEKMSVSAACEGLVALIRPQADRKNIEVSLELPAGVAAHREAPIIETDARKFQQIVFNFLSNAVKFTPESGKVTLRAERLRGADDSPRVRISVLDTGPGIAPEDQERIFEKFTRVETGLVREHTGTGLGLAICKELADLIQGSIQLVSEPGNGSMFSLIVPVAMDPQIAAERALRTAGRVAAAPLGANRPAPDDEPEGDAP
ncbi:MAG: ATP-binding protein [Phycisphaerales bacterium]